jgi:hypothetical protein
MNHDSEKSGTVDWSGENPGMYLKASESGPFITLVSFFRVVTSPHGRGHAAFLLLDPHGEGKKANQPNVCLTDNEPLAEYLATGLNILLLVLFRSSVRSGMQAGWRRCATNRVGTSCPAVTGVPTTVNGFAPQSARFSCGGAT